VSRTGATRYLHRLKLWGGDTSELTSPSLLLADQFLNALVKADHSDVTLDELAMINAHSSVLVNSGHVSGL
jgi:hypothetical protein